MFAEEMEKLTPKELYSGMKFIEEISKDYSTVEKNIGNELAKIQAEIDEFTATKNQEISDYSNKRTGEFEEYSGNEWTKWEERVRESEEYGPLQKVVRAYKRAVEAATDYYNYLSYLIFAEGGAFLGDLFIHLYYSTQDITLPLENYLILPALASVLGIPTYLKRRNKVKSENEVVDMVDTEDFNNEKLLLKYALRIVPERFLEINGEEEDQKSVEETEDIEPEIIQDI